MPLDVPVVEVGMSGAGPRGCGGGLKVEWSGSWDAEPKLQGNQSRFALNLKREDLFSSHMKCVSWFFLQ